MQFGTREIVLFLTVLLLPVVSYFTIFQPQNKRIDQATAEISHKRELLDQLRRETARSKDLVAVNDSLQERITVIESRLPTNKEIDQILRQVSALAIEAGLQPPGLKSDKPVAAARYREQPLIMTTRGTFQGFYNFLVSLERLPRITRVVEMSIKESREKDAEISVEFTLSIYFREDEGSAS
jgi:Tfp pilus assembly protein PilO|tara:strand:- start:8108 stop:8653 length:546 start_codon:yes stop_codon:yes gene_type:complete